MNLSENDVIHVARLARLKVDHDERERLRKELSSILAYMDMLREVDTGGIEPTVHVHPRTNALREDAAHSSLDIEDALVNAPCVHGHAFEVPKVIDEE